MFRDGWQPCALTALYPRHGWDGAAIQLWPRIDPMSVSPNCPRATGRQVGRVYLREVGGYALAVTSAMSAAKHRRWIHQTLESNIGTVGWFQSYFLRCHDDDAVQCRTRVS